MIVIVGLGNPGKEYVGTKHNVGFAVVDKLANKLGVQLKKDKYLFSEYGRLGDVVLVKPLTFMNEVKNAARQMIKLLAIAPNSIWVIHDDADLPLGKIKVKHGGSSAGHHGLESLDEVLGPEYWRIRIGIGRDQQGRSLTDHVLSVFDESSRDLVNEVIDRVNRLLLESIANRKLEPISLNVKKD